jgi:glutamine amidotransferase
MVKKTTVVVIDCEMGNIRSIMNKISRCGHDAVVTDNKDSIRAAGKIILPGVGHFRKGMMKLKERNLIEVLNKKVVEEKTPVLGICLGMQLFSKYSEEGDAEGLGWLDAETVKFRLKDIRHKVPHMGWNTLEQKKESLLFKDISKEHPFYFVHSYHVKCHNSQDVLSTTNYGYEFVSAVEKGNIYGTQFHPEKSHEWGEKLLLNFLNLCNVPTAGYSCSFTERSGPGKIGAV